MKGFLLQILVLFSMHGFAQETAVPKLDYLKDISDSERKNAVQKIAFKSNAKTAKYDVTYHRLFWEVDPA